MKKWKDILKNEGTGKKIKVKPCSTPNKKTSKQYCT